MHFYAKDENGNIQPKHFVPMAKDPSKTRPSRTTDAKKAAKNGEIWYSSVTTVLNILDKPALVNWKVDKHLEQAFHYGRDGITGDVESFKSQVKKYTQEKLDEAPKAGTDIHQVLEDYLFEDKSDLSGVELKIVNNVESLLIEKRINEENTIKEQYFLDEEYGYAGCADLVSSDENWVIDYKSKQENSAFLKAKQYTDHHRQLAAYGKAFFGNKVFRAANIFICLETGDISFHESTWEQLESGFADFKDCLSIHQRNTYNPKEV